MGSGGGGGGGGGPTPSNEIEDLGVEIEDEWAVEEYDLSRLSASESTGLLTFLRDRGLTLPDRAADVLRAYIETGHRFLFVQVDPSRAHEDEGRMLLSPIQVEYDSDELRVPVRLGTLNSPGKQDLLLFVLSDQGRFEVANREMLVAPSNLSLDDGARGRVAELYEAITDELFRQHPGAAVTELAAPIGARVGARHVRRLGYPEDARRGRWTLTRIRHRYGPDLDDDLVLRPTSPLRLSGRTGRQAEVAEEGRSSNFQIRYIRRHRSRAARCNPVVQRRLAASWSSRLPRRAETEGALWPGEVLRSSIELLGIEPGSEPPPRPPAPAPEPEVAPLPPPPAPPAPVTPAPPAAPPPTARNEVRDGFCAIGWRASPGLGTGLFFALAWLAARRRRRTD